MSIDDLRPYPLAPADDPSGAQSAPIAEEATTSGGRRILIVGLVLALLTSFTAAVWFAQDSAEAQREAARLAEQLAEVEAEATRSEQALGATQLTSPTQRAELFGPEMIVASLIVGRVVARNQQQPEVLSASTLVREFFGAELTTSSWLTLTGRSGVRGVLARVDEPGNPTIIWVTRRDLGTVDPAVPLREPCLALDVSRLVESVNTGRVGAPVASTAPLRFWPDVYRFVPAEQCGA